MTASTNTLIHDTFTLERRYEARVADVWRAWTDPELRQKWFRGPDDSMMIERQQDLRPGGVEILHGRMASGLETKYVARIHVVVPDRQLVHDYDMHVGGALLSCTLASVEMIADGDHTMLRYTEQGVYFDGHAESPKHRTRGVSWHLDNLRGVLAGLTRS